MVFRIDGPSRDGGRRLHLEGELEGRAVRTLRQCLRQETELTDLVLELGDVRYCDREGARLLFEAESAGCRLSDASPFVRLLIERHRGTGCADATLIVLGGDGVREPTEAQTTERKGTT